MPSTPDPAAYELITAPVVLTDPRGSVRACNAAFRRTAGREVDVGADLAAVLGLDDTQRRGLHAALAGATEPAALELTAIDGDGRPWPLRLAGRAHADGWVLTLQSCATEAALRDEVARLSDKLELARELGRLGVWERDLVSGEGRWDDAMWRMWGLPPQPRALAIEDYLRALDPADREVLRRLNAESLRRPGRYELPYRIHRPDGSQLRVHSRWDVRAGADGRPSRMVGIVRDDTEVWRLATGMVEAQAQLRLVVELADIAVWRRDLASEQLHLDVRGWTILGLPPRDAPLAAAEWQPLIQRDDLAEFDRRLGEAMAGTIRAPRDMTIRVRRSDGCWRHVLIRTVIQREGGSAGIVVTGVGLDVTERSEASQRALELARRLELATAAAGVGTWDWLPGADWHWDAQMRVLHGLAPDEPPPERERYFDEFIDAEDRAAAVDAMGLLRQRSDGMVELDVRLRGRDGALRHIATRTAVETRSGQRHMYGVMLDISARRAAEQRLRQAGERALLIARGAGIGTWETATDAQAGWWDEQMYRLRGGEPRGGSVTVDEMLQWVHPDDRPSFDERIRTAASEAYPSSYEFRVVWPDGSVRWLASRSSSLRDEHGRVVRRIGINWDVTEAHATAAALQDKLLAQRESQAKSRFLARMSHELRTPLNAVLGFSQLLLADGPAADPRTWRERVEHVRGAGEHLLNLVNDVLDLSALESGELPLQLQPVAMATLVRTTLPMLQPQADAAGIRLHSGPLEGHALADPVRLRQALINLLSNGIKYNRPGGEVWITAAPHAGRMRLAVRDNGLGLSEAQRAHLFEPFNRLGRDREHIEGTGIGLAIVQASIRRMDGRIEVDSREGEGSRFELDLPLAEPVPEPADTAALPAALPPAAAGDHRPVPWRDQLLYIEDNPVNLLIVSEMLRLRPDLRLDTAITGRDGLRLARLHRPSLVLIDMQLPDIDGLQVLRELRADEQTAGLRCIALSANAMPEDIRAARAAGFDDYWTKPLDMNTFMAALTVFFGPGPG